MENWKYFNDLFWKVPAVAISIFTGIVFAAYDQKFDGLSRIAMLFIGTIFLLALTVELIKKRHHMNALSFLIKDLQFELKLKDFQFPIGISKDIDNYLEGKKIAEDKQPLDNKDPLFKLLKKRYARQDLTYVVFASSIATALLMLMEIFR